VAGFSGTLLAPTNAAMTSAAQSTAGSLEALLGDTARLTTILKNHVRARRTFWGA